MVRFVIAVVEFGIINLIQKDSPRKAGFMIS